MQLRQSSDVSFSCTPPSAITGTGSLYAPEFHCTTGTFEQMRMKVLQQSRLTLLNAADDDVRWMQERLDNESSRFATRVQLDESLPGSLLVRREP